MADTTSLKQVGSERSEPGSVPINGLLGSPGGGEDQRGGGGGGGGSTFEYFGWVYHLGVNSIGHEYCHLRFLFIRGKYVEMYKRDPHENPDIVSLTHSANSIFIHVPSFEKFNLLLSMARNLFGGVLLALH